MVYYAWWLYHKKDLSTENSYHFNEVKPKKMEWNKDLKTDHEIPLMLEGADPRLKEILNKLENLRLVHSKCNKEKNIEDYDLIKEYLKVERYYYMVEL